jgi:hypothetical protein
MHCCLFCAAAAAGGSVPPQRVFAALVHAAHAPPGARAAVTLSAAPDGELLAAR